jgi:hypothetical protein
MRHYQISFWNFATKQDAQTLPQVYGRLVKTAGGEHQAHKLSLLFARQDLSWPARQQNGQRADTQVAMPCEFNFEHRALYKRLDPRNLRVSGEKFIPAFHRGRNKTTPNDPWDHIRGRS